MQTIDIKYIRHSEIFKKPPEKSSLTYWKTKNNDVQKIDKLLSGSKFELYTAY